MIGENRPQVEIVNERRAARPRLAVRATSTRLGTRLGWLALLAMALLLGAAYGSAAPIARADGGMATVTPDSGTMSTSFTFSVSGMTPGNGIDIMLVDGAGAHFTYQQTGTAQALVVQDDGTASVSVTPGRDLPGAQPGAWTVTFTEEETGYFVTIPFDVGP